jgi:hypothetical protein
MKLFPKIVFVSSIVLLLFVALWFWGSDRCSSVQPLSVMSTVCLAQSRFLENTRGPQLPAPPPTPAPPGGYLMQFVVTLALLSSSLFVILSARYQQKDKNWAYSTIGVIVGFWLK